MSIKIFTAASALFLGGLAAPASAMTVLEPISRGCVASSLGFICGFSNTPGGNHFTGVTNSPEARSFYIFDLGGFAGPATAAVLEFDLFDPNGVSSAEGSEALGFFQISDVSRQKLLDGAPDSAVYSDLGTGVNLGYPSFDIAERGTTKSETLGPLWLDAINGDVGGLFAVGAGVITFDGTLDPLTGAEGVFGASVDRGVRLILNPTEPSAEIPLPATLPALLLGLGALVAARRRRADGWSTRVQS